MLLDWPNNYLDRHGINSISRLNKYLYVQIHRVPKKCIADARFLQVSVGIGTQCFLKKKILCPRSLYYNSQCKHQVYFRVRCM